MKIKNAHMTRKRKYRLYTLIESIDHRGMFSYHASPTARDQPDGPNDEHARRTLKQPRQDCEQNREEERRKDALDDTRDGRRSVANPAEPGDLLAQRRDVAEGADKCDGGEPQHYKRDSAEPGSDVAEACLVRAVLQIVTVSAVSAVNEGVTHIDVVPYDVLRRDFNIFVVHC